MSHFLVIFDRRRRDDPQVVEVDDALEAQQQLFALERELRADPERGVVLLVAERIEDLKATHGQYFPSVDQLTRLVAS